MANDGQIALKITAEEAEALASLGRLVQAEDEAADGMRRMAAESRQSAAEHRALFREADKIKQSMTTPLEDYQKRLARLRQMVAANALTEEEAARAREQAGAVYVAAVQREFEASEQGQALATARAAELRREEAAARAAAKEEDALAKAAQRVKEAHQSPLDKYTAKLRELDTLLVRHKISQQEHTAAVRAAKEEYDLAGDAGDKAFGAGMLGKVTALAAGFGLATTGVEAARKALGLIKGEMDAIFERQERAAKTSMTEADAQRDFLVNLGATTPEERDQALAEIERISTETGVSMRDLYLRASEAVSARGTLPIEKALEAVEVSARFLPSAAGGGQSVAGAAIDLATILASQGRDVGAEQTAGFIQSIGETSRVRDADRLFRNSMPAIAAAMGAGATEQEAGALFSAFTIGTKDPTGESSQTAAISFVEQLRDFFTEAPQKNAPPEEQALWQRRKGVTGFGAQLKLVQSDAALAEAFLAGTSWEKRAARPSRELARGQMGAATDFQAFVNDLPRMEDAASLFRQKLRVIDTTPLQETAAIGRGFGTLNERAETLDQGDARVGAIRQEFQKLQENLGEPRLAAKLNRAFIEVDALGGDYRPFIEEIKQLRDERLRPRYGVEPAASELGFAVTKREPNALEIKQAELLNGMIVYLEKMAKVADEQLAETKKQTEKLDKPRERGRLGNPDSKQ